MSVESIKLTLLTTIQPSSVCKFLHAVFPIYYSTRTCTVKTKNLNVGVSVRSGTARNGNIPRGWSLTRTYSLLRALPMFVCQSVCLLWVTTTRHKDMICSKEWYWRCAHVGPLYPGRQTHDLAKQVPPFWHWELATHVLLLVPTPPLPVLVRCLCRWNKLAWVRWGLSSANNTEELVFVSSSHVN